ncbi:MAG: L,D-transpeptidase family protein [Gammaproteobacteria bacterium]|nr:L,D-transpeptidase family protein [Gammaproteobacteria bacterium]NIR85304.1 L,D-transpeptidase family protein [Gammaproteobacteria bacterium]NIR88420.1 L,D-transpeptidase family protein [Gammaproteobacteria bacterium]NIU06370.1 L,D-transpeptidase family protein [Gammaproteobacteria bacterium]NIV53269.1 L,D-transpeptidase family protein [Gammaproteobacteria bacterium]
MKASRYLAPAFLAGLLLVPPAFAAPLLETIADHLRQRIELDQTKVGPAPVPIDRATLMQFYDARGYRPLWIDAGGPTPAARVLRAALANADREGLDPADYPVAVIDKLAESAWPSALTDLELLLTQELVHYVRDAALGRLSPRAVDSELFLRTGDIEHLALLERAAAAAQDLDDFLDAAMPSNPVYRRLRRALARYRRIERAGGWPVLVAGPALKEGVRSARVPVLRERLEATRDITVPASEPDHFDSALTLAVQRFQRRHGLEADGVVGPATRAQLNVPVRTHIRQIVVNMERWRWMPDDLGYRYILVNLAGFELEVVESGQVVMELRTVVGRPYRRTPIFSADMTYLEFNPTWTIPPTILREDILPHVREDPRYLIERNIRVFSGWTEDARELHPLAIDWASVAPSRIPYRLRQEPGPKNPLGRVKFMFPNPFHVYLHDTPSRELFARTVRTFSSGCIRVEQPLRLAAYLLADQPGWTDERMRQIIDSGKTTVVRLSTPMPVHLSYLTVWIGEGGTIHFRDDVYGRDALLDNALSAKTTPPLSALERSLLD